MKYFMSFPFLLLIFFQLTANADEPKERNDVIQATRVAFEKRDFLQLERLSDKFDQKEKRTGSGAQKASLFDDGIYQAFSGDSEEHIRKVVSLTKKWTVEYPKSPLSHILYARALDEYAYFFRGRGYANTVSERDWEEFFKYSQLAANYLVDNKEIASQNTRWHVMMLNLGRDLEWPRETLHAIASDGIAKNPDDDRLYYWQLEFLLPKWGGSSEEVDSFINQVTKETEKNRGMELYARLYSSAEQSQYHSHLFRESKADWKIMKQGLEDWNRKYPVAWNKNIFAYLACVAGDKDTTKLLLSQIGVSPILRVWGENGKEAFNWCKNWAR